MSKQGARKSAQRSICRVVVSVNMIVAFPIRLVDPAVWVYLTTRVGVRDNSLNSKFLCSPAFRFCEIFGDTMLDLVRQLPQPSIVPHGNPRDADWQRRNCAKRQTSPI